KFESSKRLAEDIFCKPIGAAILVIGMGRVGTGAYDTLRDRLKKNVVGIETDQERVEGHREAGRNVIIADAEDPDFWEHIDLKPIELVMLSIPNYLDILEVVTRLKQAGYTGKTAGTIRYEDERELLTGAGIDVVYNFYQKVGVGFADQTIDRLEGEQEKPP
ncbi:putative Glutathione-regulated potassium-efflux system protein KefB, partial [hydrothermal vent metagenome]